MRCLVRPIASKNLVPIRVKRPIRYKYSFQRIRKSRVLISAETRQVEQSRGLVIQLINMEWYLAFIHSLFFVLYVFVCCNNGCGHRHCGGDQLKKIFLSTRLSHDM